MLDRNVNISQHKNSCSVKVDSEQRISLCKTANNSKIIRVKEGSEELKYLLSSEPFLLDNKKVIKEEPFEYSRCASDLYKWHQKVKTYLTHGVDVIQIQANKDWVYVEYLDKECEPKLYNEKMVDYIKKPKCGGEES